MATTGTPWAIQSYTQDRVRWLYSGPAPPSSTTSGVSGARLPAELAGVDDVDARHVLGDLAAVDQETSRPRIPVSDVVGGQRGGGDHLVGADHAIPAVVSRSAIWVRVQVVVLVR